MTQFNIGKDISLEVNVEKIMSYPNVVAGLVDFAIRQRLANSHASITEKTDPDAKVRKEKSQAMAEKLLASMEAGEYAIAERGSRADELTAELRRIADKELRAKMKGAGIKIDQLAKGAFAKAVAAHAEANRAKWLEAAQAAVDAKRGAEAGEVDLASLGLVATTEETPAE